MPRIPHEPKLALLLRRLSDPGLDHDGADLYNTFHYRPGTTWTKPKAVILTVALWFLLLGTAVYLGFK